MISLSRQGIFLRQEKIIGAILLYLSFIGRDMNDTLDES